MTVKLGSKDKKNISSQLTSPQRGVLVHASFKYIFSLSAPFKSQAPESCFSGSICTDEKSWKHSDRYKFHRYGITICKVKKISAGKFTCRYKLLSVCKINNTDFESMENNREFKKC